MKGAVFYCTKVQKERANEKFENILHGYDILDIKCVKFIKLKEQMSAYFENGDYWELFPLRENARGKKFNIAYVPREPDPDMLLLISACTTLYPYNGIIYY